MRRVVKQNSAWWLRESHRMYEYFRLSVHRGDNDLSLVASV